MTFDRDMAEENAASSMTNVQTNAVHRGSPTLSKQVTTLGERLAQEARTIASRHLPQFPWIRPLDTARERLNSHPLPDQERFQRTEIRPAALPARPILPEQSSEQRPFSIEQPEMPVPQGLDRLAQEAGQPLPVVLRQQIETFVGADVRHVRVHNDAMADTIARTRQADAVTVKQDVFFRQGRFQPHTDEGLALLTHEAMHVIQAMRPNAALQRTTQRGVREDEQEADTWERRTLAARRGERQLFRPPSSQPSAPEQPRSVASPPALPVSSAPPSPPSRPMTALTDRTTWQQTMPEQEQMESDSLQHTLYQDLMRRLRTDQERGG